jgi:hypothetical protein
MSIAKDLQIHSNVSIPRPSEHDKQVPQARNDISEHLEDDDDEPKVKYIGKKNWKGFMVGASLTLLLLHSSIFFIIVNFVAHEREWFYQFFDNYEKLGNGYDIAGLIVLVLVLILVSVAPAFGRKMWKIPFVIVIFVTVFYLSAFSLRQGMKNRLEQFAEYLIPLYMIGFTGSLGLCINVWSSSKKLRNSVGVSVAVPLFSILMYLQYWPLGRFSPKLWEFALYIAASAIAAYYLNMNAKLMIKRRYDFYRTSDWFLGFVHMQTDWTFRFWYDLFVPRKEENILEGGEEQKPHDVTMETRLSLEE